MKTSRERRTYDQECGLAYALDVVGERWTLLIIRELLLRPRRYNELLDALPGIGTNLLADRLAFLTAAGLIEPLEPGRRTAGYALTELGRSLHEPILGLARFGLMIGGNQPHQGGEAVRATWAALAIEAMIDSDRASQVDEVYQFEVDGEVFHVAVVDGCASTHPGPAEAPALVARTDARTFFDLGMRRLDPIEAVVGGAVQITGSPAAVPRCLRLIGLGPQQPTLAPPGGVKPPAPPVPAKPVAGKKVTVRR
ncbi:winged helix-turn-helix transcriptional regulator [Micromonospora sp. NPDC003776]